MLITPVLPKRWQDGAIHSRRKMLNTEDGCFFWGNCIVVPRAKQAIGIAQQWTPRARDIMNEKPSTKWGGQALTLIYMKEKVWVSSESILVYQARPFLALVLSLRMVGEWPGDKAWHKLTVVILMLFTRHWSTDKTSCQSLMTQCTHNIIILDHSSKIDNIKTDTKDGRRNIALTTQQKKTKLKTITVPHHLLLHGGRQEVQLSRGEGCLRRMPPRMNQLWDNLLRQLVQLDNHLYQCY